MVPAGAAPRPLALSASYDKTLCLWDVSGPRAAAAGGFPGPGAAVLEAEVGGGADGGWAAAGAWGARAGGARGDGRARASVLSAWSTAWGIGRAPVALRWNGESSEPPFPT